MVLRYWGFSLLTVSVVSVGFALVDPGPYSLVLVVMIVPLCLAVGIRLLMVAVIVTGDEIQVRNVFSTARISAADLAKASVRVREVRRFSYRSVRRAVLRYGSEAELYMTAVSRPPNLIGGQQRESTVLDAFRELGVEVKES
jgi:hypothetical protein